MNIDDSGLGSEEGRSVVGRFEIHFKEPWNTFFAGKVICGNIKLQVLEELSIRGVRAQFRGEAYVYWYNFHHHNEHHGGQIVKDHNTIWNQLFTVWGNKVGQNDNVVILSPGDYSFPFAVQIPRNNMPSSFEHRHGAIRYWVKAYIDTPSTYEVPLNRYKPFTLLQEIDVGEKHFLSKICNDAEKKATCCSCIGSRGVSLSASIDRTGYCPGESIIVNCRGKNQARRDMGGIKARLIQNIIYSVNKQLKREEHIISAIGGNNIERGRTKVWENQLLKIPPVPPTINNFGIISVLYNVQITMVIPKGVDLQFYLPITIGTKPRSVNCLNYAANVSFKRCTDGVECFNHSSKSYNFPLLAYVPHTAVMENYVFLPQRQQQRILDQSEYTLHRNFDHMDEDEENRFLIDAENENTLVT